MSRKAVVPMTARSAPRAGRRGRRRPSAACVVLDRDTLSSTIRRRCSSAWGSPDRAPSRSRRAGSARPRPPTSGRPPADRRGRWSSLELALDEPDGLAVHDVDRRVEDHATATAASSASCAACAGRRGRQFGRNCAAMTWPRSTYGGEALAVLARAEDVGGASDGPAREGVPRGRRPRPRAMPLGERRVALESRRGSSRCAGAAGSPGAVTVRGRMPRPGGALACSVLEDSNRSCMPRQIPSSGTPAAARSMSDLAEAGLARGCASPPGTRRRRAGSAPTRRGSRRGRR